MSSKNAKLLKELLDEKVRQDLGKIDLLFASQRVQMRMALNDYANSYHPYYFFCSPQNLINEMKKRVRMSRQHFANPLVKLGTELDRLKLTSQEKEYMTELFKIIDAANIYLNLEEYDLETLLLLKRVLNHYCYGEEI